MGEHLTAGTRSKGFPRATFKTFDFLLMTKTPPPPKRRAPGTVKRLAEGLGITRRAVATALAAGMPETLPEALQWRLNRTTGDDSAQALRRERIALVREQKTKFRLDNELRLKTLIPEGEVKEGIVRSFGALKNALYKLTNDVPPRLTGLDESDIQEILRVEIDRMLTALSDASHKLF